MTTLPTGLSVRSATRDDVPAIYQLGVACDLHDHGKSDFDEDDITGEWDRPEFDIDKDTWLVWSADDLVGFASIYPEGPDKTYEGYAFVHPEYRGRGIGAFLIDAFDSRGREIAGERGPLTLHTFAPNKDEAAGELILAHSFEPVRMFWRMDLELSDEAVELPCPEGIRIRRLDIADDGPAVHALLEEAFVGHWGFSPQPYERWLKQWTESRPFDESISLVAYDDQRLAGASMNFIRTDEGFIGDLGVDPDYRGRGLGACLLLRSFAIFRERGYKWVALNVDAENATGATRLYERVGMTVSRQYDVYEKAIV